jgi:hypothetical protein
MIVENRRLLQLKPYPQAPPPALLEPPWQCNWGHLGQFWTPLARFPNPRSPESLGMQPHERVFFRAL